MSSSAYKLIIEDDDGRRSVVPVELDASLDVSVGRDDANTICLNERNVSRRHARLFESDQGVYAEDLSSFNGVWLNGDRIASREAIFQGDVLRVGDFTLELQGEGLDSRRNETTQRSVSPLVEATQPGFKMGDESVEEPVLPKEAPPLVEPAGFDGLPSGESREEKTAIIRMSDFDMKDEGAEQRAAIAGSRAQLVCVTTQFAGETYDIEKTEVILGRTEDNDIALNHRSVSKHHSRIVVDGERFTIFDNGSANGTFVNDEEYASVELQSGDVIELGHVKLRFVPPGETYRFTADELSAVQDARGATSPGVAMAAGGDDQDEDTDIRKMPSQTMLLGAVVLAVVLLLIWLVVTATVGGQGSTPAVSLAVEEDKTAVPVRQRSAVEELLAEAQSAAQSRRWSRALGLAQAAIQLEPHHSQAMALEKQVLSEQAAQGHVEAARQSIAAGNWEDAWNRLSEVLSSSVYFEEVQPLLAQARGALITERIAAANRAIDVRNWESADMLAAEIATLDGTHPEVSQIQDKIRAGKVADEAAARVEQAARQGAKRHVPKVTQRPSPPKKPAAQAVKPRPKPKPKPKPAVKPAPEPEAVKVPVPSAQELYTQGAMALKDGRYDRAVQLLRRCVQVDKTFDRCYRAMGIVYARKGDPAKAARYYKKYLQVNPNARDAAQVRQLLKQYDGSD